MKIVKLDNEGRGIAYYEDKIMFVEGALEDENVEVNEIINKKKYRVATLKEIKKQSENRVTPKCPYYEECGGCNIMHMRFSHQETFKQRKVEDILKKYAGYKNEVKLIQNNQELFYRNKATLKIQHHQFGYLSAKSHAFVPIKACLLATSSINSIIQNHAFLSVEEGEIVIRSNKEEEILISITTSSKVSIQKRSIPNNVVGIVVNNKTLFGNHYFYDWIADLKCKVSYNSFFQVNPYMASRIIDLLRGNLKGNRVLDLYCGVGILGLSLKHQFKEIYGIEKIENAIEDAKLNALENEIKNAYYYVGDTGKVLAKINKDFDTIIVDPPRSGLNKETLEYLLAIQPQTIAYVSCNVLTLARDIKQLKEYYEIKKINALDMFPNTYHVECICVLNRR